ncbi:hypothetical protein IscW_ISCW010428, partial [Ixodes scapularis]
MHVAPKRTPHLQMIDGVPRSPIVKSEVYREALSFKPAADDVILVTYPKSGTHWVSQIALLILNRGQSPRDLADFVRQAPCLEINGVSVSYTSPRFLQAPKASIELLTQPLQEAKTVANKKLRVSQDHPDPDRHLLALWNRRLRLLAAYRKRGKSRRFKRRLRKIQNEIERYTTDLASEHWMQNCEQISGHIHLSKMWGILRSLLGQ